MPGANLTIAGVAAVNRVEDVLAEFGLVLKTFSVLVVITGEPEPLTPTVIAERTVIAKTTITSALDALERLDLVRREPHPTSHRSVLVRATQHGEAVAGGGARAAARIRGTLVQGQVGGDRQRLIELLGQGRSIDEMSVVRIPERLSFEEAATPPCAAVLIWRARCQVGDEDFSHLRLVSRGVVVGWVGGGPAGCARRAVRLICAGLGMPQDHGSSWGAAV